MRPEREGAAVAVDDMGGLGSQNRLVCPARLATWLNTSSRIMLRTELNREMAAE